MGRVSNGFKGPKASLEARTVCNANDVAVIVLVVKCKGNINCFFVMLFQL
jgi:hypothetical protein